MRGGTIFALSSGDGPAGVAVVRVSGPGARGAWVALAGTPPPEPRRMVRVALAGADGPIDDALGVFFAGPASFTGEDVAEFHLHGGRAVIAAALEALGQQAGLRAAEAGEFSRRAFVNGKLDLTAAEGLADLIAAETEAQRRQALRQARGDLGRVYAGWRGRIVRARAKVEGAIDFSDEGLGEELLAEARADMADLADAIATHLRAGERSRRIREGFYVVLTGAPNVGKSSLLNRLAGREAAIVSATAGTTRDVIEVRMDLNGRAVTLADTAGLRETEGDIEAEGVRRARAAAARADLVIRVVDARDPVDGAPEADGADILVVANKVDLGDAGVWTGRAVAVSARTGAGIEDLERAIARRLFAAWGDGGGETWTRERHRLALERGLMELRAFASRPEAELGAESLRAAATALGRIIGTVDVEDVLDDIFRAFCIGK